MEREGKTLKEMLDEMLAIKRAVDHLKDEDIKSCLRFVLHQIKLLKEQQNAPQGALAELVELYDELLAFREKKTFWNPEPGCTHVHIVVGESFAGGMRQALKGLGWTTTHKLITMKENYAIGPLGNLDTPEGRQARSDWFRDNITDAYEMHPSFEDEYKDLLDRLNQIPEQAEVVIWIGRSVREQVGMRHALHLLRNERNTIRLCDAGAICEELFNRADASIEYRHSGEIPAEKLQEALLRMNGSDELLAVDIKRLAEDWLRISAHGRSLRIWLDRIVQEVPADYFDSYLLEKLDQLRPPGRETEFLKSARLIGEAIGYSEQDIGDSYFEYRLRELVYAGILDIKGVPAGMRFYSIRRRWSKNQK